MKLLVLTMMWAAFLVPQLVRARLSRTPADSVSAFSRQLSVLARTSPASPLHLVPASSSAHLAQPSRAGVARRRRRVVAVLGAAAVATLAAAVAGGSAPALAVHLLADVLLGAYLVLLARTLARHRRRAAGVDEGNGNVRYLPARAASAAEPLAAGSAT